MKIVWEQSIYFGNVPVFCSICGRESRPIRSGSNQLLLAVIYNDQGVICGEACSDCVSAGPQVIRARLQDRVEILREKLADVEAIAQLAQDTIELPTLEQEFRVHRRDG
ncbi:hypothetical protein HPC62_08385 [Thermoleptolyngbya sichuanensis A183]|uniref:Uncharacterized protein n=1 Tax=Thermoleptolyngbya sichuanensis A183 TaxID=2737172 RepID=A0A6M8B5I7_9CYAN|nr:MULTISPECIES: hypothetical protein [Cyanophyceae]MDG2615263.1 hypothetical protein [Thermoleptolyngbya sichuanensis XZ-Cy5]QKD82204.1 hypothetical protein HPC62_08385 [Thermoleptolyngbya sichuanensis A183]BAU43908.1 hypothetical protein O77CONTIG1_03741 [Leptolyngbya sp. O-77]